MWSVVPSLEVIVQGLSPAFTEPSFATHCRVLIGWVMCLGHRTEFRVFEAFLGRRVSRRLRHPFDREYNFFSRSAWTVIEVAQQVAVQLVMTLVQKGSLLLIVDATLLHKRGRHVWMIGWFHDPVASTKKRVVTALGNKWVVVGLGVPIPGSERLLCLPIHAMLEKPGKGKGKRGEAELARRMLDDILRWFPEREFILVGDGGYSASQLLRGLDERVRYVGLMRSDAALHETRLPRRPKSKPGPKPKYGRRLPAPREIAKKADAADSSKSRWKWKTIRVYAYGKKRRFRVCSFQATWPKVFGERVIQVVVCRALDAGYDEVYLFTTDLNATLQWVVETYAKRTAIEGAFKSSKQVMDIQRPRHWCKGSIEKLAPWVWLMQSVVALWYLTEGRHLPEAKAARKDLGRWETEWSLRHMLRILRRVTTLHAINPTSGEKPDIQQLARQLENYLFLAA